MINTLRIENRNPMINHNDKFIKFLNDKSLFHTRNKLILLIESVFLQVKNIIKYLRR